MPQEDDLEKIEFDAPEKTKGKDVKTTISILTSVRDRLYYNKGAAHSYTSFINELLDFWFEKQAKKEIKKE